MGRRGRIGFNLMRKAVFVCAVMVAALLVSCADGDQGEGAVTKLPDDTFGFIDGSEDGRIKYPVIEFWDVPVCRCEKLTTNTGHGTRVRVMAKKERCTPILYEVEIAEGDEAGERGWVNEKFLRFEGTPPSGD